MLHDNYEATPVLDVPTVGTYYELRRRMANEARKKSTEIR